MPTLFILDQGAVLKKESLRLVIEKDKKVILEIPEFKVDRVLIYGNIQITTQAMKFLLESGIETTLLNIYGKLLGKLTPVVSKNVELRLKQYEKYQSDDFRVHLSRLLVEGKIKNHKVVIQKYKRNHPDISINKTIDELNSLLQILSNKKTVSSIMGIEGRASAIYFQLYGKLFQSLFQFDTRTKRPPKDPSNSLLSLGYTLITNEMFSCLSAIGFDPYIGYLHGISYGRPSLSVDMIEEFRSIIIDRLVLELVNKKIITLDDFKYEDNRILLKDGGLKKYFGAYENRMKETVYLPALEKSLNYRQIFYEQAYQMYHQILNDELYKPFSIR